MQMINFGINKSPILLLKLEYEIQIQVQAQNSFPCFDFEQGNTWPLTKCSSQEQDYN